jgi:diacylglycerol kinase family enzyme
VVDFCYALAAKMRAAAILGPGSSTRDLKPFQSDSQVEWLVGLPAEREGLNAILVFGGDGTVHRHLGALVRLGLPVLVVPAGSGNDFARALSLFEVRDSLEAWRRFVAGGNNARVVDLGMITPLAVSAETLAKAAISDDAEAARLKARPDTNQPQADRSRSPNHPGSESAADAASGGRGRPPLHQATQHGKPVYFACVAGVGLDGEISRRANALPRWLRAHGGYALSLPPALLAFQPFSITLSVAQPGHAEFLPRSQQPVMAVVFANTPVYGGGMRVAPRALMDDALLDICIIRDIAKLKLLSVFPSVYLGRHLSLREVEYFDAPGARIETDRPMDVYADGEYVCPTPVQLGVAHDALTVIVPARKDNQEF